MHFYLKYLQIFDSIFSYRTRLFSEVVYVATISYNHAELCVKMLNAGKHVLCEKPLSLNLKQTELVLQAAKRNNVLFVEVLDRRSLCLTWNLWILRVRMYLITYDSCIKHINMDICVQKIIIDVKMMILIGYFVNICLHIRLYTFPCKQLLYTHV